MPSFLGGKESWELILFRQSTKTKNPSGEELWLLFPHVFLDFADVSVKVVQPSDFPFKRGDCGPGSRNFRGHSPDIFF